MFLPLDFHFLYPAPVCQNVSHQWKCHKCKRLSPFFAQRSFIPKVEFVTSVVSTLWGGVTHICVNKLTIIGSDYGLSPGRCQVIIWTNDRILLIGPLETNFSESLIKIHQSSFKKICYKMSSAKCRPHCLGLNVLNVMSYIYSLLLEKPDVNQ